MTARSWLSADNLYFKFVYMCHKSTIINCFFTDSEAKLKSNTIVSNLMLPT